MLPSWKLYKVYLKVAGTMQTHIFTHLFWEMVTELLQKGKWTSFKKKNLQRMFLWTLSIVSLIFSTLSLQKRSNSDMEIATISQHIAKRINFPVLRSMTGPFFDPHWNRLPTTHALLQWFHFYLHPLKSFRWDSGRKQQKKKCPKENFSEFASTCLQRHL